MSFSKSIRIRLTFCGGSFVRSLSEYRNIGGKLLQNPRCDSLLQNVKKCQKYIPYCWPTKVCIRLKIRSLCTVQCTFCSPYPNPTLCIILQQQKTSLIVFEYKSAPLLHIIGFSNFHIIFLKIPIRNYRSFGF